MLLGFAGPELGKTQQGWICVSTTNARALRWGTGMAGADSSGQELEWPGGSLTHTCGGSVPGSRAPTKGLHIPFGLLT